MPATPPRLLVLSALAGEVRPLLARRGVLTHCHLAPASLFELRVEGRLIRVGWTGMGPAHARRFAAYVAESFPTSLAILTGYAGSTDPARGPGTLILGNEVCADQGAPLRPDKDAFARAAAQVPGALQGPQHSVSEIITEGAGKAKLADSGALALDMETHAAAGVLTEAGIPWISLRAVLDTPDHSLKGIGQFTNDDGSVRTGALIGALLKDPPLIARLIKLGSAHSAARKALIPALEQLLVEFG